MLSDNHPDRIHGIQEKLGAKSKQDIVVWAVRHGMLDPGQ